MGYSQEQFANAVGVARSTVWRWEAGGRPHQEHCLPIRRVLNLSAVEFDELLRQTAADGGPSDFAERKVGALQASWDDADNVWLQVREWPGSNLGDGQVCGLEGEVRRLVAEYEQHGPTELGPQAVRLRRETRQFLQGWQRMKIRYRLCRVAAQLAGLLAYMAVNTGRFELASAYCAEALQRAREIDDTDLQVWVSGTESLGAYYQNDYVAAYTHAARGRAMAPNNPQAIRLLANGEARALGQLGDRAGADAAVGQALTLLDRYNVDPGLTPCISFEAYGYARVAANAATAYVPLGDTTRVLRYTGNLDPAVEQADSDWSRALIRLDVAAALLRQRDTDLEQALALGEEALRVCADHPIRSVWQRAITLHELAQPWAREPQVTEFAEHLRAWQGRPQVQAISATAR